MRRSRTRRRRLGTSSRLRVCSHPNARFANDSAMVRSDAGAIVFDEGAPSGEQAAHIACHDPARVLREVAAKRAMLEDLDLTYPDAVHLRKLLAAAWSDHPDYQRDWAV